MAGTALLVSIPATANGGGSYVLLVSSTVQFTPFHIQMQQLAIQESTSISASALIRPIPLHTYIAAFLLVQEASSVGQVGGKFESSMSGIHQCM
jgi:hypothetical protein